MNVRLEAVEYGEGPPLAILHGLFGSGRNWAGVAQRLAAHHQVIALDLRNHGASPWADTRDYAEMAEDVRARLHASGHPRFALLGHSMGGKAAMVLALAHGAEVERLVVVDIAPAVYQPHHLGYVRAMRALDLGGITRRAEADSRLAPAVGDAAERSFLLQNLVFPNAAVGGEVRWRLNLAAIERAMPRLAGFPALPPSAAYLGPALFVAGARSDYLRPEHEPEIRRLFPNARIARIADAGHWPHAEQPRAFLDIVQPFLAGAVA
jgi:pimeloyl-ACP methyl ester carboxylesterase